MSKICYRCLHVSDSKTMTTVKVKGVDFRACPKCKGRMFMDGAYLVSIPVGVE